MSEHPSETDRWHAWDSFLEATPQAGFMQTSWWADFRALHGYGHFLLMLKDRGSIVGGALVLKLSYTPESCFYYIPEGPVLPRDETMAGEVFEAILDGIQERRESEEQTVSHLRIEPRLPRLPNGVSGFQAPALKDIYVEPRNTLCIDLRLSEEGILAQMKPKGRYNIRLAHRHGISVVEDTSDQGFVDFLNIYHETAARHALNAKPPDYFEELASLLFSQQYGSMFFAEYAGRRIATALVVYFGCRATYFFGGSLLEHRNVMAPYALHFEIMRRAKAIGYESYDLWGVAPQNEPDHSWRDISVFKRKFGGDEVRLVPTLDYVYEREACEEYVAIQRAPDTSD